MVHTVVSADNQDKSNSHAQNFFISSLNSGMAASRRYTRTLNPASFVSPATAVEYGKKKHGSTLPSKFFDNGNTVTGPPHPKSTVEWPSSWKSMKERTYSSPALDLLCLMSSAVLQMGCSVSSPGLSCAYIGTQPFPQ